MNSSGYLNVLLKNFSSLVTQTVKNPPVMQETQVQWGSPLEKVMAAHSSILFFFLIFFIVVDFVIH